jgi:hypothetical protein
MQKQCAIPMCGYDDLEIQKFVVCCENGHYLHRECMEAIIYHGKTFSCPMCRSSSLDVLCKNIAPTIDILNQTTISDMGGVVARIAGCFNLLESRQGEVVNHQ